MSTMQLIYYICVNTQYNNIVILDEGDRTPIQAIERLSGWHEDEKEINWKINGELEINILLIY